MINNIDSKTNDSYFGMFASKAQLPTF